MAKKTDKKAPEKMSVEEMKKQIVAKASDLLEAKRGNRAGELTNPRVITQTRKEIARLHTAIKLEEKAASDVAAREEK